MNEKVFQKSQAFIWTFRHFWEILFPSNSYFTEKGHLYIYIYLFVHCYVTCLLFQMSCGEQLKRSNGKTSFVNRLNRNEVS